MSDDLFSNQLDGERRDGTAASGAMAPLAVRMRPRTLEEVRGQGDVLKPGSPLRRLIEGQSGAAGPMSAILWGPPGTGKTTLAHLAAGSADRRFVELSAITAGVKDVRQAMEEAGRHLAMYGRSTVLFLDEIHRFTKAQQDALLPGVENRTVILVAATTENPSFSVIAPLLSRSVLVTLKSLDDEQVVDVLANALADERGFGGEFTLDEEARDQRCDIGDTEAERRRHADAAGQRAAGIACRLLRRPCRGEQVVAGVVGKRSRRFGQREPARRAVEKRLAELPLEPG